MQGIVYVDMLVVVNAIISYFILQVTAYFCAYVPNIKRIIAASFLSGLSALTMLLTNTHTLLLFFVKIMCAVLIVLLAFKYKNLRIFLKLLFYFLLFNVILGGIVIFAALNGVNNISFSNYSVYINISPVLLIGAILFMYLIIHAVMYVFGVSKTPQFVLYTAFLHNKEISGTALVDSGMHIKDAMTQTSAVLCSYKSVKPRLPKEVDSALYRFFETGELSVPFWLVNVKTATGEKMMPALSVNNVVFNKAHVKPKVKAQEKKTVFVFTNETILDESYDIIVHPSLI